MVCDGKGIVCDRLPVELTICPCCGGGIKPSRGWTWIQPVDLFGGSHTPCHCHPYCPACNPHSVDGNRAGLLWVGEKFYTVSSFLKEAKDIGISRRINSIPRGFKVGKTWIFMAHRLCVQKWKVDGPLDIMGQPKESEHVPGIFTAFRPSRIERVVKQSEYDCWSKWSNMTTEYIAESGEAPEDWEADISNKLQSDVDRGITLVPVPDNDKDHQ